VERRTAVVALLVVALLGSVLVVDSGDSVDLAETWVSDTPRDNRVNHHAAAVGPNGAALAPVAAVVGTEDLHERSCSLVRLAPGDGAVEWHAPVPVENCTTHAITAPAIGEVDGDPGREAVVATTERALIARNLEDGSESWRVALPAYGYGRPVIERVGRARAVVAVDVRGTVVLARDGTIEWQASVDDTVWSSPVVADIDDDGRSKVVITANRAVVAYDADGQREWTAATGGSSVTAANVDEDPETELLVGNESGVTVVDGGDGAIESRIPVAGQTRVSTVHTDGDGRQTVYLGITDGVVAAVDPRTGEMRWRTTISDAEQLTPAPQLADVTGDGRREVVAVANDGTVAVLDRVTGEQRATYERDVPVWTPVTTGDLDGDGAAEVIVRYGDGRVVRLDAK